jgi:hypothetical protein
MQGDNFVQLVGKITYPQLKSVGEKNTPLFNAKLAVPIVNSEKFQYVKISAWGNNAAGMNALGENTFVKVHGHIEERSYDGKCKSCGGTEKKYWTSVVVDNFGPAE